MPFPPQFGPGSGGGGGGGAVSSVFGRTGAVVANNGDYTATEVGALASTAALGGDLSGNAPNPTVAKIQGTPVSATAPSLNNILQYNGTDWVPAAGSGGAVSSVFGRTGAVVAVNTDYEASGMTFDNPSGSGRNTIVTFTNEGANQAGLSCYDTSASPGGAALAVYEQNQGDGIIVTTTANAGAGCNAINAWNGGPTNATATGTILNMQRYGTGPAIKLNSETGSGTGDVIDITQNVNGVTLNITDAGATTVDSISHTVSAMTGGNLLHQNQHTSIFNGMFIRQSAEVAGSGTFGGNFIMGENNGILMYKIDNAGNATFAGNVSDSGGNLRTTTVLQRVYYNPATSVIFACGVSGAWLALDSTNLTVSFVMPPTGVVYIELDASVKALSGSSLFWGMVAHGTTSLASDIDNMTLQGTSVGPGPAVALIKFTGTSGTLYGLDWAATCSGATAQNTYYGGGTTIATTNYGPACITVWAV